MSDYGDDYYDDDCDWFYVEDEYMQADDLAEHAVPSPPPTAYGDDDMKEEWDRFDYFNDLDYASDGYDNASFQPHDVKHPKTGQKRKRVTKIGRSKRKQRLGAGASAERLNAPLTAHSPVVWRSQSDRAPEPKVLTDATPSYALLKDWRDRLADTPGWTKALPGTEVPDTVSRASYVSLASPASELLGHEGLDNDQGMDDEAEIELSQDALMAALQRQLAAAGGPLSGMDPQQLLEFAMRMATDKNAGDGIAGEMADAMLQGEEEEGHDGAAEEKLLSWVAQQRNANKDVSAAEPKSPEAARDSKRPPTPPSSEGNLTVKATDSKTTCSGSRSKTWTAQETKVAASNKRKAASDDEPSGSSRTTKKRVTKSFDAPTAASQAKAAPTRTTRATRSQR
ncbi:hypothetical protein ACEQ8H_003407 [Pleosporales sp. CAS-2024a]